MGEREKGHELGGECTCSGKLAGQKAWQAEDSCPIHGAAHPSAGQSSLEQEVDAVINEVFKLGVCGNAWKKLTVNLAAFIRTRLAESRATMREEAAKVAEKALRPEQDTKREELLRHFIVAAIRALPADASALDARDARVREKALEEAAKMVEQYNSELTNDWNNVRLRPNLQTRIHALAKR